MAEKDKEKVSEINFEKQAPNSEKLKALRATMDKIEKVVDNITVKVKSLDGVFEVASLVSNKVTFVTDKVVDIISMIIDKIFNKRKDDKNE